MRRRKRLIPYFALTFGLGIAFSFLLPATTLLVIATLAFSAAFFAIIKFLN